MPFEILSLITFSKNLELVLHAFFTNKIKALCIYLIFKKVLRVPDQNGVSQAWYYSRDKPFWSGTLDILDVSAWLFGHLLFLSVLYACVFYFCICTCSSQWSMFHMAKRSRNRLIIIIIIIIYHISGEFLQIRGSDLISDGRLWVISFLMVTGAFRARIGSLLYIASSLDHHCELKEMYIPLKSIPKEDTLHRGCFFQQGKWQKLADQSTWYMEGNSAGFASPGKCYLKTPGDVDRR